MPDLKNVIKGLELCKEDGNFCYGKQCPYEKNFPKCVQKLLADALSLLKTQEPQPPKHIHEEYPEHDWGREKDGSIDEFALENGFHNGPRCKRCNDSFCVHCEPNGYETHKPCIVDEDRCPKCGNMIFSPWSKAQKITYCIDCGQAVKWE